MSISSLEQQIYNCHLKHFRNGEAWKPRKDFSDIPSSTLLYLQKLSLFFSKFKHINMDDFFSASKILHPEEPTPSLKFFIGRAAIKNYSLAQKQKLDQSPEKQFDKIKESLRFIAVFCLANNINLDQYLTYKIGRMPAWTQHYREHNINPYSIMELGNTSSLSNMSEDEQAIWAPNIFNNLNAIRTRYHNSPKTKSFVKEATKKIKNFIIEELKNHST